MFTKVTVTLCFLLSIVCYCLYYSWEETKKELTATQIELAQAQEVIKQKDSAIRASDAVLTQLKLDNEALKKERAEANQAITDIIENKEKPENASWGNTVIPSDIQTYLLQLNKEP